jgi:hypothetical protein
MNLLEIIKYNKSIKQNIIDLKIGDNLNGFSIVLNCNKSVKIHNINTFKTSTYYLLNGIKFHKNSTLLYKKDGIINEINITELEQQLKLENNIKILNFYFEEIEIESLELVEMPKIKWGEFINISCEKFSIFVPYSEKQILIKDTLFLYLM